MNTEQLDAENENLDKIQPETLEAEHEHLDEQHTDYASLNKKDFVKLAEDALASSDQKLMDEVMRHAKPVFDEMKEAERNLALEKFVASGGDKEDFDYKHDGLTVRFENLCRQLREKKTKLTQTTCKPSKTCWNACANSWTAKRATPVRPSSRKYNRNGKPPAPCRPPKAKNCGPTTTPWWSGSTATAAYTLNSRS